jgi:hypothetical protein
MNRSESSQQAWDDESDSEFMLINASLFSRSFRYGTRGLVTSYDPDDALTATASSPVADRTGRPRRRRPQNPALLDPRHARPDRHGPITTRSSR